MEKLMITEDKIHQLQDQRKEKWTYLKLVHDVLLDMEERTKSIRDAYLDLKLSHERADYELALLDGRYQRIEDARTQTHKRVKETKEELVAKLTQAEIEELLLELDVPKEVPQPEEIVELPTDEDEPEQLD
jgi:hypothetical protein